VANFKIKNWRGPQLIEEKKMAVEQALYKGISHILNEANNIAPKDEGTLIQTSDVDVDPEAGKANAFYTQKYARRLHEHPEYNFQGGRQGKWLEKTLLAEGDRVRDIMANEIRERLGK
jgi:hypothetical protein